MPSLTVENYLKAILQIAMKTGDDWVSPGRLVAALDVAPGTVTSMLKTLSESQLIEYRPYDGGRLTKSGRTLAMRMLRRHRLIEQFLVQTLGLAWDRIHEEAENMEHAVSDYLIDRIDDFLGHPEYDPHGDPIPSAEGQLRGDTGTAIPLLQCAIGSRVRIVRVTNQSADFLRYLTESGIDIGSEGTIIENNPDAGIIAARFAGRELPLSHTVAATLLVTPLGTEDVQ
ncbi:MAG: metal-dependent transcriptional regulator [Planctomycetes bacterium]|nr:metal-dependent transcriptional regulator [Planctomycetota bacterium]